MKRAVSISLGSSKRDKKVIIRLKDQEISVERIGTDGDVSRARQMYLDLDGKPRELHVEQAMRSIDFHDFEPPLQPNPFRDERTAQHPLVEHELFRVTAAQLARGGTMTLPGGVMHVLGVAEGGLTLSAEGYVLPLKPGAFCLLPACLRSTNLAAPALTRFLIAQAGGPIP